MLKNRTVRATIKVLCVTILALLSLFVFFSVTATAASEYVYDSGVRERILINADWRFYRGTLTGTPQDPSYNDAAWTPVSLPHTWNNADAQNNPAENYYRGDGWYRKSMLLGTQYADKKLYIEFLGANTVATVYVNGTQLNAVPHQGGYTAFRFDITGVVKLGQQNVIAVRVNNAKDNNVAPMPGSGQNVDFAIYGGIYREASIVVTDNVHVDMADYASQGVYLSTPSVSKTSATLNIRSKIVNESAAAKTVTVKATLRHPDAFEPIPTIPNPKFDTTAMYDGAVVDSVEQTFVIQPGGSVTFDRNIVVSNPRLWNGRQDPYRYVVDLDIIDGGAVVDQKTQHIGFRFFSVDNDTGFYLNGESYPLRGCNRHQDRIGLGNALTTLEHDEDFGLLYEMGVTSLRLAHYPQANYFYDLCDKYGIVVWAEIPFITGLPGSGGYGAENAARLNFVNSLRSMLVEMIRQNYNHPSIMFWGLQNEVESGNDTYMRLFMAELNNTAHTEDPYRLTTSAANTSTGINWPCDLRAWNRYDGWYGGARYDFATNMDNLKASQTRGVPTGVAEYGAGANPWQHEEYPNTVNQGGQWHPEEYQNLYHEVYLDAIQHRDWMWGAYFWNGFDFAMAGRNEGGQPGLNDKGAVTFDRQTKKDIFYLYKANWSDEPVLYITSRRFTERQASMVTVKVYSNCDSVSLYINNQLADTLYAPNQQRGVWVFNNVLLTSSVNTVSLLGYKDGEPWSDQVVWTRGLSSNTSFSSRLSSVIVDNTGKKVILTGPVTVADFFENILNTYNASFKLYAADGVTETTSGYMAEGMTVFVTAETGTATATYTVSTANLALKKPIKASYVEGANAAAYANDGDGATRWSAYGNPAGNWNNWIEVDLGASYTLTKEDIAWYASAARYYQYEVWAKNTPDDNWSRAPVYARDFAAEGYTRIVDKRTITTTGDARDMFQAGVTARYLAIRVTGGGGGALAGTIYEWEVYGWKLASDAYVVDDAAKTITATIPANTTPAAFLSGLSLLGNGSVNLNSAGSVQTGDKLRVIDISGGVTEYTLNLTLTNASGVNVSGLVKSYSPNNPAILKLMQGGVEKYSTAIAGTPGFGQKEQPFTFTDVEAGDYTLVITKDAHTSFTVQTVTVGDTDLDLTQDSRDAVKVMTLLCGDINGDRMINDNDLIVLWQAANYNKSVEQAANPLCDLNGDGVINDNDLIILWLAMNYNKGPVVIG